MKRELSLEALRDYAIANGEPKTISGRQEYLENIIQTGIFKTCFSPGLLI